MSTSKGGGEEEVGAAFDRDLHVQFFVSMLHELPSEYEGQDVNRLTLAYFAISGLHILNALHLVPKKEIIEWIYGLQVLPSSCATHENVRTTQLQLPWGSGGLEGVLLPVLGLATMCNLGNYCSTSFRTGVMYGFRGSPSIGIKMNSLGVTPSLHDGGHLAMTYSALATLKVLGDDLSRVYREGIISSMRMLQQPNGSFSPLSLGAETDLRFVYCAAAICSLLQDWSGMDSSMAIDYIRQSQSYDQGFGLSPGLESHGGATYCAIAALKLMGQIVEDSTTCEITSPVVDVQALIHWCSQKQAHSGGFRGRANKDADSCYAFWIGGSLQILGAFKFCDKMALRSFLLTCQSKYGGFSKLPDEWPDILHAYYGVCGFSLLKEPGLDPLCCELGIPVRTIYASPA
ncbi:hypothetical protein O6H91_10G080900 [Diphasiastrum complanatum]|uniref:Uncharacterized protein n=1 Tax=Diphasiastrum complanatum TaxID=34168 RepID=A0ACC2CIU8_DIPCM|nr:hypothetical protein O6H91_10G080900 [Diphasiastrum complanatum]